MSSAKQQPSNVKHGGAIRPNVWVLTFGPPCIFETNISRVQYHPLILEGKKENFDGVINDQPPVCWPNWTAGSNSMLYQLMLSNINKVHVRPRVTPHVRVEHHTVAQYPSTQSS